MTTQVVVSRDQRHRTGHGHCGNGARRRLQISTPPPHVLWLSLGYSPQASAKTHT